MSQRDQIAMALAEWAGWECGKADQRKWRIAADRVMRAVVVPALADAWDDGYKCGGMDERHDWNGWEDPFENPYRIEDSL